MIEKTLKVSGMHCRSCETLLEESLSEVGGVKSAKADSRKGSVTVSVENDAALEAAKKKIAAEGYSVK